MTKFRHTFALSALVCACARPLATPAPLARPAADTATAGVTPTAGAPHLEQPPAASLVDLTWTAASDHRIVLHPAHVPYADLLPWAPVSPHHPRGTVLLVTSAPAQHVEGNAATLLEWDVATSRVVQAKQLVGQVDEVRAVTHEGGVILASSNPDGAADQVRLTLLDANLLQVRDRRVDAGPLAHSLAIAASAHQLVLATSIQAEARAPAQRITVLDVHDFGRRAHTDVYGGPEWDGLFRSDTVVLHDDYLYVLGHDAAAVRPRPSADRMLATGPLGVLRLDPRDLRTLGFAAPPRSDDGSRAGLYAQDTRVIMLQGDVVTHFDAGLTKAHSRRIRGVGPYLARADKGATLAAPPIESLLPVPDDATFAACIPTVLPAAALYACAVDTDTSGTSLYLVAQELRVARRHRVWR